ncbi:AbrB family transcriptional regulator [Sulfolobales archaeon HS-7]|nr:AbrB family transcriptional regulator [Sulfolobales archaeon HS-7]
MRSSEQTKEQRDIEARKVQKLGSSSLFVTLPKKWINKWNIKPGDKVIVEVDSNGVLKLVAEKIKTGSGKRAVIIDIDSSKQDVENILLCMYSLGYDEIILESKKPLSQEELEEIMEAIKQISGLEITEMFGTKIKIECLLDSDKIGEDSLLRRMLNIVAKQIEDAFNSKQDEVLSLAEEMHRIYLIFSRRILGKSNYTESQKVRDTILYSTASLLYQLSNTSIQIINYLDELKGQDKESINQLVSKINNTLDEIVMSLIFPSVKRINNAIELVREIKEIAKEYVSNKPFYIFLTNLTSLFEFHVRNSSCVMYLEEFPWMEKLITSNSS